MSKLPNFEAIAIFATVAERGSFSAAADDLGITKATVSKAISKLETSLGTTLLRRTSRRFSLTEAGREVAEHGRALREMGVEAEEIARADAEALSGTIRIAAPLAFGIATLSPMLAEFQQAHPAIRLDLDLSDARTDIVADGFDLALRIANLEDSSLRALRLGGIRSHLVAAPSYLESAPSLQHPRDLPAHRCITYANASQPEIWHFDGPDGEEETVRVISALSCNEGSAMLPFLRAGLGIAILPHFFLDEDLAKGSLVDLLPDWTRTTRDLNLITPPGRHRPRRVAALIEFLEPRLRKICSETG
ncbi:MAG: LysR family transcriptional regulator [Parasphingopyxis sp.]|uniref:LysR family transcriptional regulator n=1 Tax=Parasphingopyxis sp. TaxID=1920299 RepID=UPI0032EF6C58